MSSPDPGAEKDAMREVRNAMATATTSDARVKVRRAALDALLAELEDVTEERDSFGRTMNSAIDEWRKAEVRLVLADKLAEAAERGRHAFEMLRHHRGNDKATLAWVKTFLTEGAGIFTALADFDAAAHPEPEGDPE